MQFLQPKAGLQFQPSQLCGTGPLLFLLQYICICRIYVKHKNKNFLGEKFIHLSQVSFASLTVATLKPSYKTLMGNSHFKHEKFQNKSNFRPTKTALMPPLWHNGLKS